MTAPLARLERAVADLEAAVLDAREVTRELHGAIKDARGVKRDIEQILRTGAGEAVNAQLEAQLKADLDQLGATMQKAMDDGVDKVAAEFERLGRLFLTGTTDGSGQSLEAMIRARAGARARPLIPAASSQEADARAARIADREARAARLAGPPDDDGS